MSFPFLSDLIRYLTGADIYLPVPFFGLMVAAALYVGVLVVRKEAARLHALGRLGLARIRDKTPATGGNKKNAGPRYLDVPPQDIVADLCFVTALAGMIGARVFHILEYPDQFLQDPVGMIFSRGGFTIFGGLIFGVTAGVWFVRRVGLPMLSMMDAAAPALMLGYGVGRIGCQISGDGDWGIPANMALKPEWLPNWLWTWTYENNIVGEIIPPPGVYPTPLYETLMSIVLFAALWAVRKHPFQAGWLFSLYLVFAGIERFLIEQIRVNVEYYFLGISATQAEIIAVVLIFAGIAGLGIFGRKREAATV